MADTYKVWHIATTSLENGGGPTMTLYGPDMVPDTDGALDVAIRILRRGNVILRIEGPDGFHLSSEGVLNALESRESLGTSTTRTSLKVPVIEPGLLH
jgi:hypothetical protein